MTTAKLLLLGMALPNNDNRARKDPRLAYAYPFGRSVGQEQLKLALVLNIIDPMIGGILIIGHQGGANLL